MGFKLDNIFVIDGSKRSTKANAYFTGFGPRKRIVLYDTLIKDLTEEEIVAVLAHEVGHNKKRHTVQFMLASVIQTGVILWLFSLFVNQPALSMALGGDRACFQLGLIAFTILYSPLSMILGLVMNAWSRKNEYQADAFAARYYDGESLISGLKKISVQSHPPSTVRMGILFASLFVEKNQGDRTGRSCGCRVNPVYLKYRYVFSFYSDSGFYTVRPVR